MVIRLCPGEKSSILGNFFLLDRKTLQDLPPPVVAPQTVILMLEPAAWKRLLPLVEVPVALFPRSCMSVAKALWASVMLPA